MTRTTHQVPDDIRVFTGDSTVIHTADPDTVQRGTLLTLVKPDNTVLVHDTNGYQPAAWLTRPETVRVTETDAGVQILAGGTETQLTVEVDGIQDHVTSPISPAGPAVGTCPDCDQPLIRSSGSVVCSGCHADWGLPQDATIVESRCPACRLPQMQVDRGASFTVCIDYGCDPLDVAIRNRFDGVWPCPDCQNLLKVGHQRSLSAACNRCEYQHTIPTGTVSGECSCGLPRFETANGTRCLNPGCECEVAIERSP